MCLCLKSKYQVCPICLEYKPAHIKCKICTNTTVCSSCASEMCEKGICNKCPICRQKNWKKPNKKTQILPVKSITLFENLRTVSNVTNVEIENNQENDQENDQENYEENNNCYNKINNILTMIRKLYIIIGTGILLYVAGFLTVVVFYPEIQWKDNYYYLWLPLLISSVWSALIWSPCCCGKYLSELCCTTVFI